MQVVESQKNNKDSPDATSMTGAITSDPAGHITVDTAKVLLATPQPEWIIDSGLTKPLTVNPRKLVGNDQVIARTKRIGMNYHWMKDTVSNHQSHLQHMPTEEQVADGLTKSLGETNSPKFVKMVGVKVLTSN
ncbi:hypothetical protein BJX63DRAFT_437356 [Aspergillus granulosus]|uniref:Uncharacterized protein n=1 Tax=Aspergillus granulosus TaxID=176169 RepID=A0ABR4GV86_9EURO